jgi:hypothetical protein
VPRGLDPDHHVGDHRLHELEARDRPAEDDPLARIGNRRVETRLREADGARGDREAAGLDGRHGDPVAAALLSDAVLHRDPDLAQGEIARGDRTEAELVLVRPQNEARRVARHDEGADALSPE